MVTRIQEESSNCFLGTSSGKQKKARYTGQPQFRSENNRATIEADQILVVLQQLASKTNSAGIGNIINRISKLPNSATTTNLTLDGASEKFELFEHLSKTSLKMHNQMTEYEEFSFFHSHVGDPLQTFNSINSPTRENPENILVDFRWKNVNPQ